MKRNTGLIGAVLGCAAVFLVIVTSLRFSEVMGVSEALDSPSSDSRSQSSGAAIRERRPDPEKALSVFVREPVANEVAPQSDSREREWISGVVINDDGKPVSEAVIRLTRGGLAIRLALAETTSGTQGEFAISDSCWPASWGMGGGPALLNLFISASGYQDRRVAIDSWLGDHPPREVVLRPGWNIRGRLLTRLAG